MDDDEDFIKTQYYGFFKPIVGTNQWGQLFALNLDMIDTVLSMHAVKIREMQMALKEVQNIATALHMQINPPPDEESDREEDWGSTRDRAE